MKVYSRIKRFCGNEACYKKGYHCVRYITSKFEDWDVLCLGGISEHDVRKRARRCHDQPLCRRTEDEIT
jgi:hypothetical protein